MIGIGTLMKVDNTHVTDGVAHYTVTSFRLLGLLKHIRRDKTITGKWIALGSVIVYFEKIKGGGVE